MLKTVLFQIIQFSISTQFSSIWYIDRTLSGATTPSQSGPWSDGNNGVLHIPQSSSITEAPPSDCLVWYPEHSLGVVLPFSRDAVGVFYSLSWVGQGLFSIINDAYDKVFTKEKKKKKKLKVIIFQTNYFIKKINFKISLFIIVHEMSSEKKLTIRTKI